MRRLVLAATALAAVAVPVAVIATPAQASGFDQCVSKVEWTKVHKGMTRTGVMAKTGAWGSTSTVGNGYEIAVYDRCNWRSGPRLVVLYSHLHNSGYSRLMTIDRLAGW